MSGFVPRRKGNFEIQKGKNSVPYEQYPSCRVQEFIYQIISNAYASQ